MDQIRPVIFVVDRRSSYETNIAMAALDEVLAAARKVSIGKDYCVIAIEYGCDAQLLTNGAEPLDDYTWSGISSTFLGGNIASALSILDEQLCLGQYRFKDPIVVFFTAYEQWDGWRSEIDALESRNTLFLTANRLAIHFGTGGDEEYLRGLVGAGGSVVDSIPALKRYFSLALLGCDDPAVFESFWLSTDNEEWNWEGDDWSAAESNSEDAADNEDPYEGITITVVNDLDDDQGNDSDWGGECADSGWSVDSLDNDWGDGGWSDGGWSDGGSDSDTATGGITLEVVDDLAEDPSGVAVSDVQFSAVAPKQITKGDYAMIDITVYEESYRHIVDSIISGADTPVKETFGGSHKVGENTEIRIALSSPDIDVSDCDETQIWQGKYLVYSFPIEVPASYAKRQILLVATVYFNGVIATRLKMIAACQTLREQKLEMLREDVLSAFISYASQDRSRVATIIQGMKKARPDMDIFFDVESLRSGEDWGVALRREIEARDVLYLCWSHYAKLSRWVEAEWRYALSNKGLDAIEPIPLEPPTECPPPEELNSKHFNDRTLLYK